MRSGITRFANIANETLKPPATKKQTKAKDKNRAFTPNLPDSALNALQSGVVEDKDLDAILQAVVQDDIDRVVQDNHKSASDAEDDGDDDEDKQDATDSDADEDERKRTNKRGSDKAEGKAEKTRRRGQGKAKPLSQTASLFSIGHDAHHHWSSYSPACEQLRAQHALQCFPPLRIFANQQLPKEAERKIVSAENSWLDDLLSTDDDFDLSSRESDSTASGSTPTFAASPANPDNLFDEIGLVYQTSNADLSRHIVQLSEQLDLLISEDSRAYQTIEVKAAPGGKRKPKRPPLPLYKYETHSPETTARSDTSWAIGVALDSVLARFALNALRQACDEKTRHAIPDLQEPNWCRDRPWNLVAFEQNLINLQQIWTPIMVSDFNVERLSHYGSILDKVALRKNKRRRMNIVLARAAAADHSIRNTMIKMLLCTLLGNYRHCSAASRPGCAARWSIAALFDRNLLPPAPAGTQFTTAQSVKDWLARAVRVQDKLIAEFPELLTTTMEIALREYTIFLIDASPAHRRHAEVLCQYPVYRATVLHAADTIRAYFAAETLKEGGDLAPAAILQRVPAFAARLAALLKPSIDRIIQSQSRRSPLGFAETFIGNSAYVPPRPLDYLTPEDAKLALSPAWAEREEALIASIKTIKSRQSDTSRSRFPPFAEIAHILSPSERDLEKDAMYERPGRTAELVKTLAKQPAKVQAFPHGVSIALNACIFELCSRVAHYSSPNTALLELLDVLGVLGCEQKALELIREWMRLEQRQPLAKQPRYDRMERLRTGFPYTYCVFYATCMWLMHVSRYRRVPLPENIARRQLAAVTERHARISRSNTPIPSVNSSTELWVCTVCRCVYNPVVDYTSTFDSIRNDTADSDRARVDDQTDLVRLFCRGASDFVFGHTRCTNTQVCRLPAIGWRNEEDGLKVRLICPQPACGRHFLFVPWLSCWTTHGFACWICTKRIIGERYRQELKAHPALSVLETGRAQCVLCAKTVTKLEGMTIFGPGVLVCKQHPTAKFVEKLLAASPELHDINLMSMSKEQQTRIIQSLIKLEKARKEASADSQAKRDKAMSKKPNFAQARRAHHFGD